MKLPKSFTTVTPLSKAIALSMFIIFPIFAFFLGMYYQQSIDTNIPPKVVVEYKMLRPNISPTPSTMVTVTRIQTCTSNNDCPDGYFCTRSGPIMYNPKTKALPPMTCHKSGTVVPL
ncbi:MAG TPA: hypothetical protein VLF93_07335 [Candidatus Saccharimonadales bacterium]|nr:hypothetical protein [Candidatus Saccharimonadales bacterium]